MVGRPSLTGRAEESVLLQVRVPKECRVRLRADAAEQGRSLSAIVRDGLDLLYPDGF